MRLNARQIEYVDPTPRTRTHLRPVEVVLSEHEPVLAPELVSLLAPEPGQTAVDCTFGGGGHARQVAELLGPEGTLIGIDRASTASPPRRHAEPSSSAATSRQDFAPCRAKESAQTWFM